MAVKKTAAEQPAETTVNAGLALRRLGVSHLRWPVHSGLYPEKHDLPLRCCGGSES